MARRFNLIRDTNNASSPSEIVGEGVVFTSGHVVVRWMDPLSLSIFDNYAKVLEVQAFYNITRTQWLDANMDTGEIRTRGTELLRGAEDMVLELMGPVQDEDRDFGEETLPGVSIAALVAAADREHPRA